MEIWRTIINGYPYKTPKELGCETKEEALNTLTQWHNEFTEHGYIPMGGSFDEGRVGYINEDGKMIYIWINEIISVH